MPARFHHVTGLKTAINETSQKYAHGIYCSDNKWFARVAAMQIIIYTLEKMGLKYPQMGKKEKTELEEAKKTHERE